MQNLDLARKYRPISLNEFYGNNKIKETIKNIITVEEHKPQVILISGPSGCGKTTLARLLAKEYCCNSDDSTTSKNIDNYIKTGDTSILANIHEIDIADNSGKNDLAPILEEMLIPTYMGEWKVYIFDEVHMSSTQLQNRLLKIAEEPPENVLMLLCTTNPEKLLDTLKNRCRIHLEVERPSYKEVYTLLQVISQAEGWESTKTGLDYIIDCSDGIIRTALYNLQQVGVEFGSITEETVTQIFNILPTSYYFDLLGALQKKQTLNYITTLYNIKTKVSLDYFYTELKQFVTKGVYALNGLMVDGITKNQIDVYKKFFSTFDISELSHLLEKLLTLDKNNIELELIMLGYKGLQINSNTLINTNIIQQSSNEVKEEQQHARDIKEEKQDEINLQLLDQFTKPSATVDSDFLDKLGAKPVEV